MWDIRWAVKSVSRTKDFVLYIAKYDIHLDKG